MKIEIEQDDLGMLCTCALRYCHGRQTYAPSLVIEIVTGLMEHISDKDLQVMLDDCKFQKRYELYGDERIDKPGWLAWEKFLKEEQERRKKTK